MSDVIDLLQSLSDFKPDEADHNRIWDDFTAQQNVHSVVAMIDDKIVGYGSVVIETKIRGGKMGHIEDIVSHPDHRKSGIGQAIVNALTQIANNQNCYKVSLQCKDHNIAFYERCGYETCGTAMQKF